LHW
jgi:hypothetical protein